MDFSFAEENYLKAIYHLSQQQEVVSTNAIADELQTSAASVSDMVKKLAAKQAVNHVKYKGVSMTEQGEKVALWVIRKHRLWEVFLVKKLNFSWDEVHEVAEQLEHIKSRVMIARLDEFLGFPKVDPHGDPIPDQNGHIEAPNASPLYEAPLQQLFRVVAVKDTSSAFLQYLDKLGIGIGTSLQVIDKIAFDNSIEVAINEGKNTVLVSYQVSSNILVS